MPASASISALALLLVALALPGRAHAAQVQVETLTVEGRATDVRFVDVDGDGKRDAVIATSSTDGPSARQLRLHLRQAAGFSLAPVAVFEVPANVVLADLADVDGNPGAELLLADDQGVASVAFDHGRFAEPKRFLTVSSFFRRAESRALPFAPLARDLDLDGRVDLLIPGADGYVLWRGDAGAKFSGPFPLDASRVENVEPAENAFFRITASLAHATPADWDGDGKGDLLLAFEQRLLRVVLGASGPPAPATLLFDLGRLLDAGKSGADGLVLSSGLLRDIDGDGRCDMLVTQRSARPTLMSGIATRTLVFLSQDLASAAQKPRQVIKISGVSGKPQLVDLDRDGAADLVVTQVETDPLTKLKETVLDAVKVSFQVYRFDKDETRFEDEPAFADSLQVGADRLLAVGAGGDIGVDADHDGDGRPDFARYDAKSRVLTVRKGVAKSGFFSSTPIAFEDDAFATASVDLPGALRGEDVDGDGNAEIVACGENRVVVVRIAR